MGRGLVHSQRLGTLGGWDIAGTRRQTIPFGFRTENYTTKIYVKIYVDNDGLVLFFQYLFVLPVETTYRNMILWECDGLMIEAYFLNVPVQYKVGLIQINLVPNESIKSEYKWATANIWIEPINGKTIWHCDSPSCSKEVTWMSCLRNEVQRLYTILNSHVECKLEVVHIE